MRTAARTRSGVLRGAPAARPCGGWCSKGQTPRRCLQPGHPVRTAHREPQTTTVLGPKMSPPKVCSVLCVEEEGECRRATPRWPAAAVSRPCPEQTVRSYTRSRSRGAVWGAAGCCPAWESQWVGSEDGAVLAGSRCGGVPTPEHVGVSCCEVRAPQLSSPPCPRWGRQCWAGRERVGFEGAWDPRGGDHGYLLQFQSIWRLPLVPGGPRKVLRGRPAPPQPWVTEDG